MAVAKNRLLSPRETVILALIATGHSSKSIAQKLQRAPKTIDKQRANLMRKIKLHNAALLTLYAVREKLVDPTSVLNGTVDKSVGRRCLRCGAGPEWLE